MDRLEDIEPEISKSKTEDVGKKPLTLRVVSIFVDWIYAQRLMLFPWDSFNDEEQTSSQIGLLKANVFGDRVLSPLLSKAVRHNFIRTLAKFQ